MTFIVHGIFGGQQSQFQGSILAAIGILGVIMSSLVIYFLKHKIRLIACQVIAVFQNQSFASKPTVEFKLDTEFLFIDKLTNDR